MNNCNKCYYNSFLHDRYVINNDKLKIKYSDYKLKEMLNLEIIEHNDKHKIINKLKITSDKHKHFHVYYKENCGYKLNSLYYCIFNCMFCYKYYVTPKINKYCTNGERTNYLYDNLTHNQIIIEINNNIYVYYSDYYATKSLNKYLQHKDFFKKLHY